MKVVSSMVLLIRLIPEIFFGWLEFYLRFLQRLMDFWMEKELKDKALFILLLLQTAASTQGWVSYQVNFTGVAETVNVSVKLNIVFILCSLTVFFFTGFWSAVWVRYVFLPLQGICILLYLLGILFTGTFFVDFLQSSDYKLNWFCYIYGGSILASTAFYLFFNPDRI